MSVVPSFAKVVVNYVVISQVMLHMNHRVANSCISKDLENN
jgi:hypothetical protein